VPLLAALVLVAATPAAAAANPAAGLQKSLTRVMRAAGPHSGAFVRDADTGGRLFAWHSAAPRILASNTKLFTTGAALARFGPDGTLATRAMAAHALNVTTGVVRGNLYLVGGGDPAFGSRSFVRSEYGGGGATVEKLAKKLYDSGLRAVRGRVVGDESLFDTRRGGPADGYSASSYIGGPLSALAYNHGLTSSGGFQSDPSSYAAARLTDALRRQGVKISHSAKGGRAPSGAAELARSASLPIRDLTQLTALPSDNYFAELLAKGVGDGTTAGGARAIVAFTRTRGAQIRLSDGSGLSRSSQAAPQEVVRYLDNERPTPEFIAFYDSLPIAGVNGTLHNRLRSGLARRHCRAKTGTLHDVSTLSGYCASRGGHTLVFSILMNGLSDSGRGESLQDRMVQSIAKYKG
jgi:D-alanyl-D-alanine carboxypeptidase/D-alanyl-D-alanine-endopeptidase (penicillin-binding protein 4)